MAIIELKYSSEAVGMMADVNVILPDNVAEGETYKTLYLLHGLKGDHSSWLRLSCIERYATQWGIAVVMPAVGRSWYTDTAYGARYFTFVTEELPRVCRKFFRGMTDRREDNYVAGLSMGGYGAMKVALTYPQRYAGCASLSGALDITRQDFPIPEAFLRELQAIFGMTPDQMPGSKHDLFALADKIKASGEAFPEMYLWCGTEDFLLGMNRRFNAHLEQLDVKYSYNESEGNHTWPWWDLHIQDALRYLLGEPKNP